MVKPSLIKEWHPSKNGNLTPRNVSVEHNEKVWWLCENEHEWEDTIKNRIEGKGCFVCGPNLAKENSKKDLITSQQLKADNKKITTTQKDFLRYRIDSLTSGTTIEYRKYPRFKNIATAILEDPVSGNSIYAQMQNISRGGMYLETNTMLRQGEPIRIKFNKPLSFTGSKTLSSTVRWCKDLTDDEGYTYGYGIGVKFN
jgi:hypothetical protein